MHLHESLKKKRAQCVGTSQGQIQPVILVGEAISVILAVKSHNGFATAKLYAHGMRPLRFSGACVLFRDVTSFFDASGKVCVRVETVSILTHQTHCPGFGKER